MADGNGSLKYLHGHGLNRQREDRLEELQRLVVAQATWPCGLAIELLKHLHGNGKVRLREHFSRAMAHVGVDKA